MKRCNMCNQEFSERKPQRVAVARDKQCGCVVRATLVTDEDRTWDQYSRVDGYDVEIVSAEEAGRSIFDRNCSLSYHGVLVR